MHCVENVHSLYDGNSDSVTFNSYFMCEGSVLHAVFTKHILIGHILKVVFVFILSFLRWFCFCRIELLNVIHVAVICILHLLWLHNLWIYITAIWLYHSYIIHRCCINTEELFSYANILPYGLWISAVICHTCVLIDWCMSFLCHDQKNGTTTAYVEHMYVVSK